MALRTRPSHRRHRVAAVVTASLLGLAAPAAGATSASASAAPVPDFDERPLCVIDILAISCFVQGTATGGGEIVSWEWEYPGAFGNTASGQSTTLRFDTTGVFNVTLTVTDDQDQTGSVTKRMVVEIGG
jgi:PKD domain-containing protein